MSTTTDDRNWHDWTIAHMAAQKTGTELPR
jgi:hypothetical protein